MKLRQIIIIAVLLLGWVNNSNAKGYKPAKVYMFGFAASFNDSTIYMTNIQKLNVYLANDRTNFLANREEYSFQLHSYLQNNGMLNYPTCVTIYSENENKAMKKFITLKNKYEKGKKKYNVKIISASKFNYQTIEPQNYNPNEELQVTDKNVSKSK